MKSNNKLIASFEKIGEIITILNDRTVLKNGKNVGKLPDTMNINDFISTLRKEGFTKVLESFKEIISKL